jgi:cytochrome b
MNHESLRSRILVWDAAVRVFHWLMVLSFAGAYLTAESERWRLVHVTLGYTMAGLITFRLGWGVFGTRHARFRNFVRGPQVVMRYVRTLLEGNPTHFTGHNPAGAVAIVLMLLAGAVISVTGWASYNDVGGEWLSELHEVAANAMILVVGVHIAGVIVASKMHNENLVRSMVTGFKLGEHRERVHGSWWPLALLIVVTVVGFWWLQWQSAPTV